MTAIMKRFFYIILLLAAVQAAGAQRISRNYQKQSMADVLIDLAKATNAYKISFIYNELEDYTVTKRITDKTIPEAVSEVVGFYPMTITTGDSLITVECVDKSNRKLSGRIVDEKGEPVLYANVQLLNPADSAFITGGVSNENGDFVIPCAADEVIAKFSCIGYSALCVATPVKKVGNITMHPKSYTINGVVVKGSAPKYRMTQGGMSVNVENSLLSMAGTAGNVLAELPRVKVDAKGDVNVFAKGTPEIYINNRLVRDNKELTQLKSTDISSVDIITSPGAKYNAEAKSVIKINTKPVKGEGFSARAEANPKFNPAWNGYGQIDTRYRKNGLEIFNTFYADRNVSYEDNRLTYEMNTDRRKTFIDHSLNTIFKSAAINEKVGFNYEINPGNSFGAYYSLRKSLHGKGVGKNNLMKIFRDGQPDGTINNNALIYAGNGPTHEASSYYMGKAGKLDINVNATYIWRKSGRNDLWKEESETYENREVHTGNSNHSNMTAGKVVLGYPVGKGTLNAGTEATLTNTHSVYNNPENLIPSSRSDIKETNVAPFAEYSVSVGDWSFDAGLRYEHVSTDYRSNGVKEKEPSRKYDDLYPNLSAEWSKGDWNLSLGYTKKTSRPGYFALRNNVQYDGRFLYEAGNPYLRPNITHNIEFNAVYKWASLNMGYNYDKNQLTYYNSLYNGEEIAISKWSNLRKCQNVYASVSLSPKFGFWQPTFEAEFNKPFVSYREYGINENLQRAGAYFELDNKFVISKKNFFTLDYSYGIPSDGTCSHLKQYSSLDLGYTCVLFHDALMLNAKANDILKGTKERWTNYGNAVKVTKDCYNHTRNFSLTLTYNFNTAKSHYKGTGAGNAEKRRL